MKELEQKYTMSIILNTISIFKCRFFYLLLLRFSPSFIESASLRPERREETKSIRKNGGTVITSAGGIGSPAKYKDISHENEERRV